MSDYGYDEAGARELLGRVYLIDGVDTWWASANRNLGYYSPVILWAMGGDYRRLVRDEIDRLTTEDY